MNNIVLFIKANITRYLFGFNLVLILSYIVFAIYSTLNLKGFLGGHLGFAGPHLYASSLNLSYFPSIIASSVDSDLEVVHLYNHHPKLGFYVYWLISFLSDGTYAGKLQIAYIFSTVINIIGVITLYFALRYIKINKVLCLFAVAYVFSTHYFNFYLTLTNFDSLSILMSSGLLFSFKTLYDDLILPNLQHSLKQHIYSWLIIFLSMNTSYYFFCINAFFVLTIFFIAIINHKLKSNIKKLITFSSLMFILAFISITTVLLSLYLYAGNLDSFVDLIQRDAPDYKNAGDRQLSLLGLISNFDIYLRSILPSKKIAILIMGLIIYYFIKFKKFYCNELCWLPILGGCIVFIIATRYWSAFHPFAFSILMIGGISFLVSAFNIYLEDKSFPLVIAILTTLMLFSSISVLKHTYQSNLSISHLSQNIVKLFDKKYSHDYSLYFKDSMPMCRGFNHGQFWFLASHPNYQASQNKTLPKKTILVECKKDDLVFTDLEKLVSYKFTSNSSEPTIYQLDK